jgi:hypothetical protein
VKLKLSLISAVVCLSMLTYARPGTAQLQPLNTEPELVSQMLQEGWQKVAEGVLQRNGEGSQVETFTYGDEGLRWTARRLEGRLSHLQNEYSAHPDPKLAQVIESVKNELIQVDQNLKGGAGQVEMVSPGEMSDCTISYGAHAYADPLTGNEGQGVKASADAYFHNNCGFIGNSFSYAYSRATAGTVTTTKFQEDPKNNSTWIDSAAASTVSGSTDCFSEATARVSSSMLNIYYESYDANYSCPAPVYPPAVSISGPYDVYFDDYYYCDYITWYANVSGGTPGYSYAWYIDGSYQGSGTSVTQYHCGPSHGINVQLYVNDSAGQSGSASFTTWVYYQRSCTSRCGCIEPYPYQQQQIESSPQAICPYQPY